VVEVAPLVAVDQDAVVVTAVKLADDGSGDVVVRLHEAHGGRVRATLTAGFEVADVAATDLLERALPDTPAYDGRRVALRLRPFELVTLRLRRAS
ncbi:glycosyl hydrolase-related protein, partial [Streptomyces sp. NPDC006356]